MVDFDAMKSQEREERIAYEKRSTRRKEVAGLLLFVIPGALHWSGHGELAPYAFTAMAVYLLSIIVDDHVHRLNKRIDDL